MMAGEHKPYPPSEQKLRQLRQQGVVAWSRELAAFVSLVGAGAASALLLPRISGLVAEAGEQLRHRPLTGVTTNATSTTTASAGAGIAVEEIDTGVLFGPLIGMTSLWLGVIVAVVIIGGFAQTRGLLAMSLLTPRFNRLFSPDRLSHGGGRRLFGMCGRLLLFGALLMAGWLTLGPPESVAGFVLRKGEISVAPAVSRLGELSDLARRTLLVALCCGFFGGVISRFLVVLAYRGDHAMTKAEIEAEAREGEMSGEMRRSIGDAR